MGKFMIAAESANNWEEIRVGLRALSAHLEAGRPAILRAWQQAAEQDPTPGVAASLSRSEFYDDMPRVLDTLGEKLRVWPEPDTPRQHKAESKAASDHGAHRWQQGYDLQEMVREWGLFNLVMVDELDAYGSSHPETNQDVLSAARRALAELIGQSIASSVAEFDRLQRAGAEARARDLEVLLGEREGFDRERGELLREASHDLRGGLSVVRGAASLLGDPRLPEDEKGGVVKILQQSADSLHEMLSKMLDLARLEAGREERELRVLDVAPLLLELGASVRLAAQAKGLSFDCDGPETLPVEGDAVRIRRIAQNLLLNAVQYTSSGGVSLSWSLYGETEQHWVLQVRDTGPGIVQAAAVPGADGSVSGASEDSQSSGENVRIHGEGVGLMIVKRLCELLDARLELDSRAGEGSLFRVIFPLRYPAP